MWLNQYILNVKVEFITIPKSSQIHELINKPIISANFDKVLYLL